MSKSRSLNIFLGRVSILKINQFIFKVVGSNHFFMVILVLFLLQILWIILSARFPMMFDERYHLGIIQAYTQQLSPFITQQDASLDVFGDITRYTSYAYHYLMSFPLRITQQFTSYSELQIIILRLFSSVFAVGTIIFLRKSLLLIFTSKPIVHFSLLILIFIPIVPFLSAHINYDNLLLLLSAIFLYYAMLSLKTGITKSINVALLLGTGMFASIVKYAFLPIFAIVTAYLTVYALRKHGKRFFTLLRVDFAGQKKYLSIFVAAFLLLGVTLVSERYIGNLLIYHTPVPDCSRVLSVERCLQYAPWARNYDLRQSEPNISKNVLSYTLEWSSLMLMTSSYVGASTDHGAKRAAPLPLIRSILLVGTILGLACTVYYWRLWIKNKTVVFISLLALGYIGSVWLLNYSEYLQLGRPIAVQWRYLLPVVPFVIALFISSINMAISRWQLVRLLTIIIILLLFTQGGGVTTYILRSDQDWYWKNKTVIDVNEAARRVVSPFVRE